MRCEVQLCSNVALKCVEVAEKWLCDSSCERVGRSCVAMWEIVVWLCEVENCCALWNCCASVYSCVAMLFSGIAGMIV